ncbi:MAG: MFS transporter [Candidatus Latescibacteria bacterium]|nr:MFS transporter [Candidatus Latescibacterota bacterium]
MKNDRRTIVGWAMYDWANSAYFTTIAAALLPHYFASSIVPEEGYTLFGRLYDGQTLWGYTVSFGAFLMFLLTPVLGAIADFSASKKRFLRAFAYSGALFATLLVFVGTGDVIRTLVIFFITQMGFVGANVFYDGFLPEITTLDTIDRVSAKGYAYGYIGGGLQFALALGLVAGHTTVGISLALAVKLSLAMAGLWWFGFSVFALSRLREARNAQSLPADYRTLPMLIAYARVGIGRTWATTRKLWGFKQMMRFLVAYVVYNDGVQTVIDMASVYGTDTLKLSTTAIMVTFLIVQLIAFFGALFFGVLADRVGAKRAVLISLGLWGLVVINAYSMPEGAAVRFFILGAAVGLVLGGTQSLSRSLYGSMIPEEASAEFYGFYSVFSKFSAIWGPFIFATVNHLTGSARNAILSLIALFIVGAILLAKVDVEKARASRLRWRFEGAEAEVE